MIFRTHLAVGIFGILLFLPLVNNPLVFAISTIFATGLPDIDTPFSKFGKHKFLRIIQFFTEHRGMIHSLTFCILVSLLISVFFPVVAFGFFLGYSLHLLSDSFTKSGITPFWPYSKKAKGNIVTGGIVEKGILFVFVIFDLLLLMRMLF